MEGGATIRAAEPGDAPVLADLHLDVWEDAYADLVPRALLDARRATPHQRRAARWAQRLHATPTWVAEDGSGLVGLACAGPGRDAGGGLELMALYVRARCYDTGTGSGLLRAAIGDRPAYLWVLAGNTRAIRFYEHKGFAFDGQAKDEDEGLELRMVRG